MLRRVSPDITSTPQILSYPIHYTNKLDKDYKGRIERIDSYNKKKKGHFVTLQLLPRAKWDKDAKEIF